MGVASGFVPVVPAVLIRKVVHGVPFVLSIVVPCRSMYAEPDQPVDPALTESVRIGERVRGREREREREPFDSTVRAWPR